jgi:hypothetical protein
VKKPMVLVSVISAVMLCSVIACAQSSDEKQMDKERMGGIMSMMGVMQKQMVATSDGGVIVLTGNKLLKYDKDLNLVKEAELQSGVELKMDMGSMQDMMEKMKEKYGKHSKAKEGQTQDTEKK